MVASTKKKPKDPMQIANQIVSNKNNKMQCVHGVLYKLPFLLILTNHHYFEF